MALQTIYDSIDDVPEFLQPHVAEKGGKFIVDVPDMVSKDSLKEFRNTNIALQKQLAERQTEITTIQARYEGVDVDAYKAYVAEREKVVGVQHIAIADHQKALKEIEGRLKQELGAQIAQEREQREEAQRQLDRADLTRTIMQVAPSIGVQETAVADVADRAAGVFRRVDGEFVAMSGEQPLYSDEEPSRLLGVEEFIKGLAKTKPHYFKTSNGSGTPGGPGQMQNGVRVISPDQIINHLDDVASGKVVVRQ